MSKTKAAPKDSEDMSLFEHLAELRKRLIIAASFILVLSALSFGYATELFAFLTEPYFAGFKNAQLIGTGPAEAFLLKIKVALLAGIVLSTPLIFHQVWLFIAPGLHAHEKKYFIPFVISTSALFLTGVSFCLLIVLPYAFEFFFNQYLSIGVTPTIRISEHLSLMIKAVLGFGLAFEMPVLAFFLGRLGLISHTMLIAGTRYAIVTIFVLSAILTPPDVFSQFLMAGPLMLLYGISILIVKYTGLRPSEEPEANEKPE